MNEIRAVREIGRNLSGQGVVGQVKISESGQTTKLWRDLAMEVVEFEVETSKEGEVPYRRR